MRKVILMTEDIYLFKKAKLLLADKAEVLNGDGSGAEVIAEDTYRDGRRGLEIINCGERNFLPLPCLNSDFIKAFMQSGSGVRLKLSQEGRCAYLDGEEIRLTETEFTLLSLLVAAGGNAVKRETILEEVFRGGDRGIINVYIHYLREKLERGGEKIILSSRLAGYSVNEKFIGDKNATTY